MVKSISGGFLAQTPDSHRLSRAELQVKTKRAPTDDEWAALQFALESLQARQVQRHRLRAHHRRTRPIDIGGRRSDELAWIPPSFGAMKAVLPLKGSVLASDAFFPFPDGVEEAAKHGITAAIQPGGSVNDDKVIAAADALGLAMVFTGVRHFRH